MTLPPALRERVEAGHGPVRATHPVGGGCIHSAARVELPGGPAFLKWGVAPPGLFGTEAVALDALRPRADGLTVPRVLGVADGNGTEPGWLLLEWLDTSPGTGGETLGRGLAALHAPAGGGWGWERDGWIGPLPQRNTPASSWAEFWWTRRLEPQLRSARDAGRSPGEPAEWSTLRERLPELLAPAEADRPSLLHGDLWSGNALALRGGGAALVDPAPYRAHREVDLAMSELFGGFPASFYAAYREMRPLLPGYRSGRRAIYQLYPLLVHLNLFGGGYLASTGEVLRSALAA